VPNPGILLIEKDVQVRFLLWKTDIDLTTH